MHVSLFTPLYYWTSGDSRNSVQGIVSHTYSKTKKRQSFHLQGPFTLRKLATFVNDPLIIKCLKIAYYGVLNA